jgi:hypothetical protein
MEVDERSQKQRLTGKNGKIYLTLKDEVEDTFQLAVKAPHLVCKHRDTVFTNKPQRLAVNSASIAA